MRKDATSTLLVCVATVPSTEASWQYISEVITATPSRSMSLVEFSQTYIQIVRLEQVEEEEQSASVAMRVFKSQGLGEITSLMIAWI